MDTSLLVEHADVPLYPGLARAARLSGTVRIHVQVRNGVVVSTEARSDAHAVLVNADLSNVKTWQFSTDASGAFDVTYVYELEEGEVGLTPEPARVEMQLPNLVKISSQAR